MSHLPDTNTEISVVEQKHPAVKLLDDITALVEETPYLTEGQNRPFVDPKRLNPLVQEVVHKLRDIGYSADHTDELASLYGLNYFDLQTAKVLTGTSDTDRLRLPVGQVFHVLDSAIDRIDPNANRWRSPINSAVSDEVSAVRDKVQEEVLEAKGLVGQVQLPKDIPTEAREQIVDLTKLRLSERRIEIANDPVSYTTNLIRR